MKLDLSNRAKKYIKRAVIIYLLFDLRPLLLIPNAILFLTSKNVRCVDGVKCYQVRVFPKLNVGGDSVTAVFSQKNISNNPIKYDEVFERSYDRSGAFHEFQLSGKTGWNADIETFYTLLHGGIGGGLEGGQPYSKGQKIISVNNYIRISKAGLYRVNFNYWGDISGGESKEYDLGNFFVLQFPENYVSKTIQSIIFACAGLIPNEKIVVWGIKHLGYQDSWLSQYLLIKYFPAYYYDNAESWAIEGIVRNKNILMVSRLMERFWKKHNGRFYKLNHIYLWAHTHYLLENNIKENIAKERLTSLLEHFYVKLNDNHKRNWKTVWSEGRDWRTDENYLKVFKDIDQKIADATTQREKDNLIEHKKWVTGMYNDKEKRYRQIRLIDFMLSKTESI